MYNGIYFSFFGKKILKSIKVYNYQLSINNLKNEKTYKIKFIHIN